MKFAITREALLQPLQQVIGVVERRQTLPILANVMLEVNSGLLAVTATDLEVELIGKIALEQPHEEGVTTVPARKLLDICRSLPDGASIEIETAEGRLHLRAGRSRYRLATLAAEEFPNVDEGQAPALAAFAVAQSILKRLIEKTSFAMAQQDVRFYLCGMLLEISGGAGQLRGVATDGHRLAMYTVENIESVATGLLSNRVQAIIPRKGTLEIARLLKESEEPVRVQLTQHHLRIENSDVVIISKLVD
ncbi:MAG TPA: DNA polymerase III subunit beta, partial [Pseudomonadales bacterium]|nr:DNA polymerase III subunit beta [Pseudomonadales bacterium]